MKNSWFSNEQLIKLNHLLAKLTRSNQYTESLKLFTQIHSSHTLRPDHYTLSTALTASANTRHVTFGNQLHSHAIQTGLKAHSHVANSLLSLYAKSEHLASVEGVFAEIQNPDVYSWTTLLAALTRLGHVDYALQVFDEIPMRNVAIWNAIITGCADNGHEGFAMDLFRDMHRMGVRPDNYTFASMLSLCSLELLDYGRHVHGLVIRSGFLGRNSVVNSLITMYFNCGCVVDACEVFEETEAALRDHITYNAMIDGFVTMDRNEDAFMMFREMQRGGFGVTELTFVSVMSSCSSLRVGCQAQAHAIKTGFVAFAAVNNATMTMYSSFGEVNEAQNIFERMEERDLVSWNIMISTFFQENLKEAAILIYLRMRRAGIEPDEFTYGSLLAASDSLQIVEMIHCLLSKNGLMKVEVLNALISTYCRHGKIKRAFQIFSDLPYQNLISWNSIISGFLINGCPQQGLKQFSALLNTHLKPNAYTLSLILSICSSISTMSHGKQVHGYILRQGFSSEISLGNALVTMYAKCGSLDRSLKVFNAMVERDTISWNALISAYAQHGEGEEAVYCFETMQISPGIKPDQATFTAVLSACSHAGLVDDGTRIFDMMVKIYGLLPSVDHFSCIVDLLGRSGYLDEAERVIESGCFGAHSNICWSLFSACAAHGNIRLGRTVARLLLERDHNNPSVYVLLSNICAAAGQWEEAANLRDMMRDFGSTKQPGCSWIRT
ncbi:pentatricopeptide repeat-containing protein At3g49740 [Gastrolobium bilobum]|uniref:pentatricopeptide repeat-containing protein At3g49740 n=1 Tax=Gastrolobium bilobum TaxID=150636 RepID=UPI002AB1A5E6|nr:pentatricopeptide repeat-containing protein At3g49740 [Gastrolobium bilobum]